jgi:hypothetical protein
MFGLKLPLGSFLELLYALRLRRVDLLRVLAHDCPMRTASQPRLSHDCGLDAVPTKMQFPQTGNIETLTSIVPSANEVSTHQGDGVPLGLEG